MKSEKFRIKKSLPSEKQPPKEHSRDIVPRTFEFAVQITKLCQGLNENGGVGRVLYPQVLRSGTSVGSNVEEAQAAESKADFIHKMLIALKEARETHYRLRILDAAGVSTKDNVSTLVQEALEIKLVIGAIVVSAKR